MTTPGKMNPRDDDDGGVGAAMVEAALREEPFELQRCPPHEETLGGLSLVAGLRKRRFGAACAEAIEDTLEACEGDACRGRPEWQRDWIRRARDGVLARLAPCHAPSAAARAAAASAAYGDAYVAEARALAELRKRVREASATVCELRAEARCALAARAAAEDAALETTRAATGGPPIDGSLAAAIDDSLAVAKSAADAVPRQASELKELIAVVEENYERRKRARGSDARPPSPTPSVVLAPIARLAEHLDRDETLVDFIDGAGGDGARLYAGPDDGGSLGELP